MIQQTIILNSGWLRFLHDHGNENEMYSCRLKVLLQASWHSHHVKRRQRSIFLHRRGSK